MGEFEKIFENSFKKTLKMQTQLSIVLIAACLGCHGQILNDTTVPTPPTDPTHPISVICSGITCPDDEDGLFAMGECSNYFCECDEGIPFRLECEPPLVFNEDEGYCDWCYNMCDKCGECEECGKH